MSLGNLLGTLAQYAGGNADPSKAEEHFDQVSQNAPQSQVAGGLAEAFRSNQTPAFGDMIGNLFSQSDGQQKAGILSHLLQAAGPSLLGSGALGGILGSLGGGSNQVTPEQAQNVSPEQVKDLANQAQQHNPSIVDQASQFYAQHPTLVKALGAGALAMIMSHVSRQQR